MADLLEFLTAEDRERLMASAVRHEYRVDDVILEEGDAGNAIFVLQKGRARVERRHMDFQIEIASLAAGEVFGEMSFVDAIDASATVVADGNCVVDVVDNDHVHALMKADPGFYGRFYQSLAAVLSRRLRETTDLGIAEFAWGGRTFEAGPERHVDDGGWGGGNPFGELSEGADTAGRG